MSLRRASLFAACIFTAVVIISFAGCSAKKSTDKIVIGAVLPTSGGTKTFGESTRNGINLAINEVNKNGGVLGKKVEIIIEDDRSDTAEAKTAVTKLITRDKVLAVLGEITSTRTLSAAQVAQANKIPMITPAATNEKVTQVGDNIFRVCFLDAFQGEVCARFAAEKGLRRAAILKDIRNDYSIGLADAFSKTFKKLGGTIAANESYSEGDTDFSSQLTVIRGAKPDVLFIPGYYTEVSLIAIKARQLGIKTVMMGGDGWDSPVLLKNAGSAVEGCYFSNHFNSDIPDQRVQSFVKAYKEAYNETPDALAALGYDAAAILLDAIRRAGSTDSKKIRDAIAATKDFAGVTGRMTIDQYRNAKKPAVILQIKGKAFKHVASITP